MDSFSKRRHKITYEAGTDNVPKRRHIKFRCRGITQKKEWNKKGYILKWLKVKKRYLNTCIRQSVILCHTQNVRRCTSLFRTDPYERAVR